MYKILTVEETVRVPPKRFGDDLEKAIISEFEDNLAGRIDKKVGIILAVTTVDKVSEGKIIMGDGAIYFNATFDILVYQPVINEVVEGSVTELTEFGAFVNFGPMDGLIHVSQVTEDFMSYDSKSAVLAGRETKKVLKTGDEVRARVITVSMKSRFSESKIGLTMRQPHLGKLEWIEEEKKGGGKEKKVAPEKKAKAKKEKKTRKK
ncbi:MAG: DNA-directed RNA polymerase [Candidatus Altiarchaeota archaeon]|nr:DNA-directed RNA polymerase [Candidatus Altiarchaeota archaeon]